MANITLKIDDELLDKARKLAEKKNTSLNAVVREMIRDFVRSDTETQDVINGLNDFYQRCSARMDSKSWTRDELHER